MAYMHLADDEATSPTEAEILAIVRQVRLDQERAERFRRLSFAATVGGAVFAAIRLGILFAPKWKRRQVQEAVSS